MLTTEWNWDIALAVREEEGREEGYEEVFDLLEQGYTLEEIKARLGACCTCGFFA
jgi:hypothetical protein